MIIPAYMRHLESIEHLIFLLNTDPEIKTLLQKKGFNFAMNKIKGRFSNIQDFDEKHINKLIRIRDCMINHLVDEENKLTPRWKNLVLSNFYYTLYAEEMDSEDKRYARRAGVWRFIDEYKEPHRSRIEEIIEELSEKASTNTIKNGEELMQYSWYLFYKLFTLNRLPNNHFHDVNEDDLPF